MRDLLVVKIGAIGDVLMALPLASAAKLKNPRIRITWLCGNVVEPLVRASNDVDRVIVVDERRLLSGGLFIRIAELLRIWRAIAPMRFDHVVIGNSHPFYLAVALPFWGRASIGRFKPRPGIHHTDEYVAMVSDASSPQTAHLDSSEFSLPAEMQETIDRTTKPRIALVPAAAQNVVRDDPLRRWPIENYAALAQALVGAGIAVFLVGGRNDAWALSHIRTGESFIGKTTLKESLALLSKMDLVITHDTGPMHMACAVGVPVLALFGPTRPDEKFRPTHPSSRLIWGGAALPCRPCYDGRHYAPCSHQDCMKSIRVEVVLQTALEILKASEKHDANRSRVS